MSTAPIGENGHFQNDTMQTLNNEKEFNKEFNKEELLIQDILPSGLLDEINANKQENGFGDCITKDGTEMMEKSCTSFLKESINDSFQQEEKTPFNQSKIRSHDVSIKRFQQYLLPEYFDLVNERGEFPRNNYSSKNI